MSTALRSRSEIKTAIEKMRDPKELGDLVSELIGERDALAAERDRLREAIKAAAETLDQSGGDRYAIEARGILRAALAPGTPVDVE